MDPRDYWNIAETGLEIQNPITAEKLSLLEHYCDLADGQRVLDIGCGKAWLLRQWADRYAIEGTGVDINPHFIDFASSQPVARGRLTFILDALHNVELAPGSWDIVICLGASFAVGEVPQALDYMSRATRPGGRMVFGDLVLRNPPAVSRGQVLPPSITDMIAIIERQEAEVTATISASDADFERYASHHRHATLTWARRNPGHMHEASMLETSQQHWAHYQQHVRPMLGWTIFVARSLR